jgi:DNA-binding GntR family transcriptional regulator
MNSLSSLAEDIASRRGKSLSALIAEEIERMIMRGDVRPGERINEKRLAEQLNVTRGILREARSGLIKSGLLVSVPNKGVFVRKLSPQELEENAEVRELITAFICERAAQRVTDRDREALQQFLAEMDAAIALGDGVTYYHANVRFHDYLMHLADHRRASAIANDLWRESHLARQMVLSDPQQMRVSNDEHREIVDAVVAGDAARAAEAGRRHVSRGRGRWRLILPAQQG